MTTWAVIQGINRKLETEDEVFITHEAATRGVEIANTGSEPLVSLRYFGPDTFDKVPNVGDEVRVDGALVTVLTTTGRRVRKVRVTKVPSSPATAERPN